MSGNKVISYLLRSRTRAEPNSYYDLYKREKRFLRMECWSCNRLKDKVLSRIIDCSMNNVLFFNLQLLILLEEDKLSCRHGQR